MSIAVVIAVAAGFLFFICYYAFAKIELFRLERYEYWSDRFYAAAKPLVAHPDTPSSTILMIESLNDLITYSDAPIGIDRVFRRKLGSKTSAKTDPNEAFVNFFSKYPDLARHAETVSHAGLLAASYVSFIGGERARAILADVFSEMQLQPYEISDAEDVREIQAIHRGAYLVPSIIRR